MTLYVRAPTDERWHWCENCSKYPLELANTTHHRPDDSLCEECEALETAGECEESP